MIQLLWSAMLFPTATSEFWNCCAYLQLSGNLLSAYGYGAPEFESGSYTVQSDVYSFGVVMLELLTGRQSYDRQVNFKKKKEKKKNSWL